MRRPHNNSGLEGEQADLPHPQRAVLHRLSRLPAQLVRDLHLHSMHVDELAEVGDEGEGAAGVEHLGVDEDTPVDTVSQGRHYGPLVLALLAPRQREREGAGIGAQRLREERLLVLGLHHCSQRLLLCRLRLLGVVPPLGLPQHVGVTCCRGALYDFPLVTIPQVEHLRGGRDKRLHCPLVPPHMQVEQLQSVAIRPLQEALDVVAVVEATQRVGAEKLRLLPEHLHEPRRILLPVGPHLGLIPPEDPLRHPNEEIRPPAARDDGRIRC